MCTAGTRRVGYAKLVGVEEQGRRIGYLKCLLLLAEAELLVGDCVDQTIADSRGQGVVLSLRLLDLVGMYISVLLTFSIVLELQKTSCKSKVTLRQNCQNWKRTFCLVIS